MAAADERELVGGSTREMYDALSELHLEAMVVSARGNVLDQRIRDAVAAAPSAESTGGTVHVLPLSPTADPGGLAAALAEREDLIGGDDLLLDMAREYAAYLPHLLPRMSPARSRFRMLIWDRKVRADALDAVREGRRIFDKALRERWTERFRAARQRTDDSPAASGPAYAKVAGSIERHGRVVGALTGLTPDTPSPIIDAPQLRLAAGLAATAGWLVGSEQERRRQVHRHYERARDALVTRSLDKVPLTRLREAATITGLRVSALEEAGLTSVADVSRLSLDDLDAIPGVGPVTAKQVYAAARQLVAAAADDVKFRLDLDRTDAASGELVSALMAWSRVGLATMWVRKDLEGLRADIGDLAPLASGALPPDGIALVLRSADAPPAEFANRVTRWVQWWGARHTDVQRAYDEVRRSTASPAPASVAGAWDDFEQRPAEYYSWLSAIVGVDQEAVERGELPEEIVASIRALKLDLSLVTASVRGYQEFGARFALVQERTILGDEMGLGKTVQAIAAMAHLAVAGERHALVVCPASVLVNWQRELARHSRLTTYRLHGEDRAAAVADWIREGGVGVTTYGQLYALDIPAKLPISLLVADEAHYLKNPLSQRSLAFQRYLARCPRVLLMSGTPLENRLDEFATLVGYLQPHLLAQIDPAAALVKAAAFREAIAPVYLRRNQEDVLTELPDLVETDEWVDLTSTDRQVYAAAVRSGNFMAMRQAAWQATEAQPAKLERLVEIVEEATDNGHRVIVFSYFRSVLDRIAAALTRALPAVPVFGPLTGSLSAEARQQLVDDFGRSERPGVLVSQIEAGGVGLNIQAASVVVLAEPQIKPSSESQAIARVHRMGQVGTVQVHRILGDDSVDERMLQILQEKDAVFAAYVRDSAVSEAAPEAIDVSERNLAARIVAEEQRRLASGPQDAPPEPRVTPQDASSARPSRQQPGEQSQADREDRE